MKVKLVDSLGTDLSVVNAARVSFDKKAQWERNKYNTRQNKAHIKKLC